MTSEGKTVPEIYEDVAREYELKAKRETSLQMKAVYAGMAREYRQRASQWHRYTQPRAGAPT